METTIFNKEKIIDILHCLKLEIEPYRTNDTGAYILFDINEILVLLDHGVHNMLEFALMQLRVIYLLKHFNNVMDNPLCTIYVKNQGCMESLKRSADLLEVYAKREIRGQECLREYIEYGFELHSYHSEYVEKEKKKIAKVVKAMDDLINKVDQQDTQRSEQDCPGCIKDQQQEEHHDT